MTHWDKDTIKLVQSLNDKLKLDHSKWHNDKETIEYIEESIKWLKEINVDKPCPSKNHLFKAN